MIVTFNTGIRKQFRYYEDLCEYLEHYRAEGTKLHVTDVRGNWKAATRPTHYTRKAS